MSRQNQGGNGLHARRPADSTGPRPGKRFTDVLVVIEGTPMAKRAPWLKWPMPRRESPRPGWRGLLPQRQRPVSRPQPLADLAAEQPARPRGQPEYAPPPLDDRPADRALLARQPSLEFEGDLKGSFESQLKNGLRFLLIGLATAGGWATMMPISGAIVAAGILVSESSIKKVQHPTGGVIADIPVRDGMHVNAGDIVARLDETGTRTAHHVVLNQLQEIRARIDRLSAERDGLPLPQQPGPLQQTAAASQDTQQLLASENALFKARAESRLGLKELLDNRIEQLGQEIAGLEAQGKANEVQAALTEAELKVIEPLWEKHLVPLTRINSVRKDAARFEGERARLQSDIAQARSKVGEARLQILRIDQEFHTEVAKDLRESQDKEAELVEHNIAAQDQAKRVALRAPTSGTVHELAVHTVGGVVTPAEVLMTIVPDTDELQIEARLKPNEIDGVHVGQDARVRFSAFNQRTTPELNAAVSYVSADVTQDTRSAASYYTVRVALRGHERDRLGDLQLIAGMPAEVFLKTGSRTMLSYLFKPITDQVERMFRER